MAKTAASGTTPDQSAIQDKVRVRKSFPSFNLQKTLELADAIAVENAGRPWSRLSLAEAVSRKPDSSAFRELLSASIQYGLTEGSYKSTQIKLTALGEQATMPKSPAERQRALLKAARNIALFNDLYVHFDQAKLPAEANFRNTLIRDHNVDAAVALKCIEQFTADGKFVGLIRSVAGSDRVDIPTAESAAQLGQGELERDEPDDEEPVTPDPEPAPNAPTPLACGGVPQPPAPPHQPPAGSAIFIAHGHDHEALQSLEGILKPMGVKYIIAKDEAHGGRPISEKVANGMRECSAAIFIASGDDEVTDSAGNKVKRTRQNVVYELGAASFLYGRRIVIFKEKGVEFPTDFSDLGYIEYERGRLSEKFADLIKELVQLKAVTISAGGS